MLITPEALLDGAVKKLIERRGETIVTGFFEQAEALAIEGDRLIVKIENDLTRDVVETRFGPEFNDIISDLAGTRMRGEFLSDPMRYRRYEKSSVVYDFRKYTFDTFIVGTSNRFAHAAALAVANAACQQSGSRDPALALNPLFIYGAPGLGKTHLLLAIKELINTHRYDKNVIYISAEEFTNDFVQSLGSMDEFRERYRSADVFLMDDVQFLVTKERTNEEFFHTFNTLFQSEKQIVLTSDRPPKELPRLDQRAISRFEQGLITDIQPPELETRIALVNSKAAQRGLELTPDVSEYIASNIKSNVRQIEGVVTKLAAYSVMMGGKTDMESARRAVKEYIRESPGVTPQTILREVAAYTGVDSEKILGTGRTNEVAQARQIFVYITTQMTHMSLSDIGKFLKKDHSTMLHSRDRISELIAIDTEMANTVRDIMKNIQNG